MTEYQERQIKELKDTIKLYQDIKDKAEIAHKNNCYAVPNELNPYNFERKIMYYLAVLSVYEYYINQLGDREYLMFGKYIGFSMNIFGNELRCNLYLEDNETASKLYYYVFGSHSGINEFVQDHFPDIFSVILGSTGYSHSLGCYDLNSVFNFFKHFGYTDYKRESLCWNQKGFDADIDKAKKILDWCFKISENAELMNDIDKVLTTYFEVVFKYNTEE